MFSQLSLTPLFGTPTFGLILVSLLYTVAFGLSETLYRRGLASQITRKLTHMGGAIISASLPFFVSLPIALSLGFLFALILIWTKRAGWLGSVHHIDRASVGAILFPISLLLTAILFWPIDPLIFQIATLILGLSDGLAGLIGEQWGRWHYHLTGLKSVEGSLTFFGVTVLILLIMLWAQALPTTPTRLGLVLAGTTMLTFIEALVGRGWDNLPVPIVAGVVVAMLF